MATDMRQSSPTDVKPKSLADMTDEEFSRLVGPAPAWLEAAWARSKELGHDTMTMEEIDAEIAAYRREMREAAQSGPK